LHSPGLPAIEWFVAMTDGYDAIAGQYQVSIHHVRKAPDNDVTDFRSKVALAVFIEKTDRGSVHALKPAPVFA
jgi:hypothetical protein